MVFSTRACSTVALPLLLVLARPAGALGQLFQGPAQGTSDPGVVINTATFPPQPAGPVQQLLRPPPHELSLLPTPPGVPIPLAPVGFNEQDDPAGFLAPVSLAPTLLTNFEGITMTTSFPPDPIIAAGPDHLMPLVNRHFAIFDKAGTNLQEIDAPTWYANVVTPSGAFAFDPKVIYDHFDDRWVMVWLAVDINERTSHILVSVSDDSDPNGNWCNWALPGNQNGSTVVSNWSDYQGLGFDENAVYVVPNQFSFDDGFFDYVKIRILPKVTLYDSACPSIIYTDFWDLRDPDMGNLVGTVRPAVTFGTPGVEFLINDSPFVAGSFMTLWSLTDPLSPTPGLTAVNVPTTERRPPPNAGQPADTTPIDVGGPRVRNLVYREGSVWTAHSVADASGEFARARYVRIDVAGPTVLEDVSFGTDGCWLYYPAIAADATSGITIVFSRSCTDEFASVRFTGRTAVDPALQASAELKAGEDIYVLTGGGSRNRWGDYSGIAVDPANPLRVWMVGEYAESPASTWGTWIGQSVLRPLGDINNDLAVDIADLTLLIDFILERQTPTADQASFADCTRDAGIDIGDVVCVVDVILGTSTPAPPVASIVPTGPSGGPLEARLSPHRSGVTSDARSVLLELDAADGIAAVYARITYDPARVRIEGVEPSTGAEGLRLASHDRGGELALVLYSIGGKTLRPGDGPLARIRLRVREPNASASSDLGLWLSDVSLADRGGRVVAAQVGRGQLTTLPERFRLSEIFPNPIGPSSSARMRLDIPESVVPSLSGSAARRGPGGSVRVRVDVYNVRGQKIGTVMDRELSPGQHTIEWDGLDERGRRLGLGLYILRVSAGREFVATRKLIVGNR